MELKPWMVAGMVVFTAGIGSVSLYYGNPQTMVKASAQPIEDDFESRIATAKGQAGTVTQASVATVPGLAPAAGQPAGAQRSEAGTAGRGGATTTSPAGNTGSASTLTHSPAPAPQNNAPVSGVPVSVSANASANTPATAASSAQTQVNNQPPTGTVVQAPGQLTTDALWAEATRLKGATDSAEIKRRLDVNRELFNRLWATRRTAEQQSRDAKDRSTYDAAQAQVQTTTRQINEVEAAIAADNAQVSGT